MRPSRTSQLLGAALGAGMLFTAGCSALPDNAELTAGNLRLVAFTSCDEAADQLRSATLNAIDIAGASILNGVQLLHAEPAIADSAQEAAAPALSVDRASPGGHSGTNVHEAGVDEPDLVKTDGNRIVTIHDGVLRVVDAQRRAEIGRLELTDPHPEQAVRGWWQPSDLLLHGDRALVLMHGSWWGGTPVPLPEPLPLPEPMDEPAQSADTTSTDGEVLAEPDAPVSAAAELPPVDLPVVSPVSGPKLVLVDLSTPAPTVVSEYAVDGTLLDARATEQTVRVVVRSTPRLEVQGNFSDQEELLAAQRAVVEEADVTAWLPRYELTTGDTTESGHIDCTAVSHPAEYSGTSMLTVLTFDLTSDSLGDGLPVSVAADGETVYSNGTNLYVASDQRWQIMTTADTIADIDAASGTMIYKFDVSQSGKPRYVGAGAVDGWLLNQYAMSEWEGHLRVATTTGQTWGEDPDSESAVYVLAEQDGRLVEVGSVGGLGATERIYAVRYAGPVAYLVTFRETDPLYTVDLSDPTAPEVLGELKITGYSSYLHPIGEGRLLGIGQEADEQGRTQGVQISLFDVSDLANPTVLDRFHIPNAHSEAEHDPHAFLWWPQQQLLVVPISTWDSHTPEFGALALRVDGTTLTELDLLIQPTLGTNSYPHTINRVLVTDDTLWTLSHAGLQANALSTLNQIAWIPFT